MLPATWGAACIVGGGENKAAATVIPAMPAARTVPLSMSARATAGARIDLGDILGRLGGVASVDGDAFAATCGGRIEDRGGRERRARGGAPHRRGSRIEDGDDVGRVGGVDPWST
jgi:hypothetical protein